MLFISSDVHYILKLCVILFSSISTSADGSSEQLRSTLMRLGARSVPDILQIRPPGSLSSWTECSPQHLLLWHPSRSSWPPGTGPPCSKGGHASSHRRSKTDLGSGGSQVEEETFTDQRKHTAPVASVSSETCFRAKEGKSSQVK